MFQIGDWVQLTKETKNRGVGLLGELYPGVYEVGATSEAGGVHFWSIPYWQITCMPDIDLELADPPQ